MASRSTSADKRAPAAKRRRGAAGIRDEILATLMEDHKRAKKAFRDFEKLDAAKQSDECRTLVQQTCAELTVHATLEEEVFYPAVRRALKEADLIDEAEVEHASAKELIGQLQGMGPGDDKFAAKFVVLGEYVKHHIKEEESEMFPKLERARLDWEGLAEEMTSRRESLTAQLLSSRGDGGAQAQDEASDAEDEAKPPVAGRQRSRSSDADE